MREGLVWFRLLERMAAMPGTDLAVLKGGAGGHGGADGWGSARSSGLVMQLGTPPAMGGVVALLEYGVYLHWVRIDPLNRCPE